MPWEPELWVVEAVRMGMDRPRVEREAAGMGLDVPALLARYARDYVELKLRTV